MLCSPSRNPVREQHLDAQINYHKLPIKSRQLTRRLAQCTKKGRKYKMAYVKKKFTQKTRDARVAYGKEDQDRTIDDFWQFIFFKD